MGNFKSKSTKGTSVGPYKLQSADQCKLENIDLVAKKRAAGIILPAGNYFARRNDALHQLPLSLRRDPTTSRLHTFRVDKRQVKVAGK